PRDDVGLEAWRRRHQSDRPAVRLVRQQLRLQHGGQATRERVLGRKDTALRAGRVVPEAARAVLVLSVARAGDVAALRLAGHGRAALAVGTEPPPVHEIPWQRSGGFAFREPGDCAKHRRSAIAAEYPEAGILGREAFRFDGSDPRFITELLQGPLDPGSGAFGGNFWSQHYAAIRSTNNLLNVIGTASALSAQEQNATRGFAETMQAYSFLMVLMARNQDSIPIAVNVPVTAAPAPFVTN